jgi:hypothetical protein
MPIDFSSLLPFEDALRSLARRGVLPSSLDSTGLRALGANFHRANFTSAQTVLTDLLEGYKARVAKILNPLESTRVDRVTPSNPGGRVQVGLDPAQALLEIRELQRSLGYQPEADQAGTITDLSSDARIKLVLRTNTQLAQGAGSFARAQDPELLDLWPAQELYRLEPRDQERDWAQRWRIAAAVAGDARALAAMELHGQMAALKSSGIWQALGDGEGGFLDTLGNPYPPFAFNSGMWTRELSREEAEDLGLLTSEDVVEANGLGVEGLFGEVAA